MVDDARGVAYNLNSMNAGTKLQRLQGNAAQAGLLQGQLYAYLVCPLRPNRTQIARPGDQLA